jgi:hypothetical protein
MSPQNSILRYESNEDEDLMAAIDQRSRWMNRFDLWLFLSVWVVIITVAGLASRSAIENRAAPERLARSTALSQR